MRVEVTEGPEMGVNTYVTNSVNAPVAGNARVSKAWTGIV